MMRTVVLCCGLIAAALPIAAGAQSSRGLPAGWTMPDDATFAPSDKRWGYVAPKSRRGIYAHGASGEIGEEPGTNVATGEKCTSSFGSPGAPEDQQGEEYWYFESDGEALLLLKTDTRIYDSACKETIRSSYGIERATIRRDGFTRFIATPTGWRAETHTFDEYRLKKINDIAIGLRGSALVRFVVRKRRLDDSDVGGKIGAIDTHCVMYSSPPDGGGAQCWSAGSGGSIGLVTSDYELFAGSPYVTHNVTELEEGIALDGRLFEWDRPIRRKPS